HSQAGRREMRPGDVLLLRPGVWHGYENCQRFEVYNCCFGSELLRRELAWTREDPLLGFLLCAGPYSSSGRGVLSISLPPSVLGDCLDQLVAQAALRHPDEPVTSIGRTVGWPDQSSFARRFKAHYGLSATTYRKRFATGTTHRHQPAAAS